MEKKVIKEEKQFLIILVFIIAIIGVMFIFKNGNSTTDLNIGGKYSAHVDETFNRNDFTGLGHPMLVMLGCDTCSSCKSAIKTIENLAVELEDKAFIKYIDYEEYPSLLSDYSIRVIPTVFFYDEEGTPYSKIEGVMSRKDILSTFSEMGYDFNE